MLLVLLVVCTPARAQAPPPLEPPAEADEPPPIKSEVQPAKKTDKPSVLESKPTSSPKQASPEAEKPVVRPLLVIPGVTAPAQETPPRPRGSARPRVQPPRTAAPALSGPTDPTPDRKGVVQSRVEPRSVVEPRIPMTLEPIEDEPAGDAREVRRPAASPREGTAANRAPNPQPARQQGFFARLLGIPAPVERQSPATRKAEPPRPASRAGATGDPRRTLEREIQRTLGDRARSIEVRVSGKNALVVVKPTRFWQKRSIRSTLEAMPALADYHARIEILD